MITALLVPTDPDTPAQQVQFQPEIPLQLAAMQAYVNGVLPEVAAKVAGMLVWVDADARTTQRPVNHRVTAWLDEHGDGLSVLGDVVLTGPTDPDGDITSLTTTQTAELRARAGWST